MSVEEDGKWQRCGLLIYYVHSVPASEGICSRVQTVHVAVHADDTVRALTEFVGVGKTSDPFLRI